jgi:membrane protein
VLRVDMLQLQPVLEALAGLDWVGQINDLASGLAEVPEPRYVLLVDPADTPLAPLVNRLLLDQAPSLDALWSNARLRELQMADVL